MRRTTDAIIIVALFILSGVLYFTMPRRPHVSLTESPPLAIAEFVPGLQRGTSVNLVAAKSNISGDQWHPEKITVKSNAAVAPDATETAFLLTETKDNGLHRTETRIDGINPGEVYTLSVFVKPGSRSGILLEMRDGVVGKYGIARFDLAHNQLAQEGGDVNDAGIQILPNNWYRCWATMVYLTDTAVFDFTILQSDGGGFYVGNHSDLFIWGVQFERGNSVTGYSDQVISK